MHHKSEEQNRCKKTIKTQSEVKMFLQDPRTMNLFGKFKVETT